jgi:hypothetical protein
MRAIEKRVERIEATIGNEQEAITSIEIHLVRPPEIPGGPPQMVGDITLPCGKEKT